jgi:hypothetical protein
VHQEIVLGESGQVFEVETSDLPRAPVSVVVTNHAGEVQSAITRCTLDPVATVLSEDAPRGARMLHVGSTRGITPGARYDVGGQRITVYRLDGEHRLVLRRPLLEAAREDTALRGCRLLAPIDDAWVCDASKLTEHIGAAAGYELVWTHAGGTERTTADVVGAPLTARVTPDDVEQRFPGWQQKVDDPVRAIAEAAEIVRRDILRQLGSRRAREAALVRELVILRARLVAIEEAVMFRGEPPATLAAAEAPYLAGIAALSPMPPPKAALPPKPRPAAAPVEPQVAYSLEHVRIVDEVMAWFAARPSIDAAALRNFQETLLGRVRTADERHAVAQFLAAQTSIRRDARLIRRSIMRYLRGETARLDDPDLETIDFSRLQVLDWLVEWLEGRAVLRVRDLVHLERFFMPHLKTREECEEAARLLRARRTESELGNKAQHQLVHALVAKSFAIGAREDA